MKLTKVLYISPNGYLGGAERFVITAADGHKTSKNIDASILFFSGGAASEEAKLLGINSFVLKNSFRLRNPWRLYKALKEIRQLVYRLRPDILHLTMPYSHIVLSLATVGLRVKKVWFQHGPVGGQLDKIANFFPVDMVWYNSRYLKMLHHQSLPHSKFNYQEAIINLGVRQIEVQHELFSKPALVFGTAGRVCSGKGFHNIVRALGELKSEQGLMAYQFFIAGAANSIEDKHYMEKLRELIKFFKLDEEIIFLDHVKDMDSFYQSLDVFIHSSVVPEPFGLVVAEAMMNGCLVVGSGSGGLADFLLNGTTGLTFSSTSDNAVLELKTILVEILKSDHAQRENFRNIGAAGKNFIYKNFSLNKMIAQIEGLYFQLVNNQNIDP